MRKFLPGKINLKFWICLFLCLAVCITVPCMSSNKHTESAAKEEKLLLRIWQIDGFEGGKGSRADYLQKVGDKFSKSGGAFVTVTSLSAEAARTNLEAGNKPDLISFGAGMYGLDSFIQSYTVWCRGGYCFLTLDGDFTDINTENLIVNSGKDNLVGATAALCGVSGAKFEKATGAYVKLINGNYKYLLGTQRDIFRLRTRGVSYKIKPITEFNDLYQSIAVTAEGIRINFCDKFIEYLKKEVGGISKLGLFSDSAVLYDDDMRQMEGLTFDCRLTSPISEKAFSDVKNAIDKCDINTLKNLFN